MSLASGLRPHAVRLLRRLLPERRRQRLIHLLHRLAPMPSQPSLPASGALGPRLRAPSRQLQPGLCIGGHLRSEIGLGQAARNLAYAGDAARLPVSFLNLAIPGRENDAEFASKCNAAQDRRASLFVSGMAALDAQAPQLLPGRHTILYPFWELSRVPPAWHAAIRRHDEVWAPSRFVAEAVESSLGLAVPVLPQAVRLPAAMPPPRAGREALRFFTFLDTDSAVARKNPQAAVQAFRDAFPASVRDVELVVKARGDRGAELRLWLAEQADADPRIRIIDRTLDRGAMDALMAECDVFVSLHRSEGFGFGAAEALAAGKAVVATDYSGTTDFIDPTTGYPVAYRLEPVGEGEYVAHEGQAWATALPEAAAAALRSIRDDPAGAEARTRHGFDRLRQTHGLQAVGARLGQLLRERGLA